MTKEEFEKVIINSTELVNKLSDDLDKVIWGEIQKNTDLFDSMCKSEKITVVQLYDTVSILKSKLNLYSRLILSR